MSTSSLAKPNPLLHRSHNNPLTSPTLHFWVLVNPVLSAAWQWSTLELSLPYSSTIKSKTKGIPSNSQDVIQAHAHAIESYIHNHVGINYDTGEMGGMYFNRTLEDWIGYQINNRTKFDLTISSGLALLAAQKARLKKAPSNMSDKVFLRRFKAY